MWTVTGVRPCTEANLTPGSVSCPGAMSCPGIMWTGPLSLKDLYACYKGITYESDSSCFSWVISCTSFSWSYPGLSQVCIRYFNRRWRMFCLQKLFRQDLLHNPARFALGISIVADECFVYKNCSDKICCIQEPLIWHLLGKWSSVTTISRIRRRHLRYDLFFSCSMTTSKTLE